MLTDRVPFPPHPDDLPWPTAEWPTEAPSADVDGAAIERTLDTLFAQPPELGLTLAVVLIHRGRLVAERYADDHDASSTLISWSMAKSITHAAVGLLVGDGLLSTSQPAAIEAWASDQRRNITIQHLLEMRDGLAFTEDYVDDKVSHVIEMLFGAGKHDHAGYTAALPLAHEPGAHWNYSSGTTNIVARLIGDVVGGAAPQEREAAMRGFLSRRLFDPIGMRSAEPKFDEVGTFVGSSYVYATAQDFARFGYLYLRDGVWDGRRILPVGWTDHARTMHTRDPEGDLDYGAHWWGWRDEPGSLAAHGYEGQYTVVLPERDLVMVRLGKTVADLRPNLFPQLRTLIDAFPRINGAACRA